MTKHQYIMQLDTPLLTFTEVKLVIRTKKMTPGWIDKEVLKGAPIKYNFERVQYYTGKWDGYIQPN